MPPSLYALPAWLGCCAQMEADDKGDWGDVIFIPPGTLAGEAAAGPKAAGKGGKK